MIFAAKRRFGGAGGSVVDYVNVIHKRAGHTTKRATSHTFLAGVEIKGYLQPLKP
jgi:hypothetical protein